MDLAGRLVAALDVDEIESVAEGHQSRVFRVIGRNGPAVVKVLDASVVDRTDLEARLDVTAAVADLDPQVCRPLSLGEHRITELISEAGSNHYVVCFEFAAGAAPDPVRTADAELMGAALSRLHLAMGQLPKASLPVVSALRAVGGESVPLAGADQLVHGDFNASNLRQADGILRIFDFDDCGYAPPAFDVANALYMVLFDASTSGAVGTYDTFRQSFLDGYVTASSSPLPMEAVDRFVDLRVQALGIWLDDPANAPIGVRNATPAWQATLRSFVADYRPRTG